MAALAKASVRFGVFLGLATSTAIVLGGSAGWLADAFYKNAAVGHWPLDWVGVVVGVIMVTWSISKRLSSPLLGRWRRVAPALHFLRVMLFGGLTGFALHWLDSRAGLMPASPLDWAILGVMVANIWFVEKRATNWFHRQILG